ncbi:MAG: hypothetical protein COV99_09840 [Bacteroidetes bacterium CG12_big_fil_rev_8_21_14_0_65_60_17]|nr:MAG: hypothetical protein COV99_09840 [Bacteroidetes bacterium CG12_big_fil_rev_8_21_14_0_65_60_17]
MTTTMLRFRHLLTATVLTGAIMMGCASSDPLYSPSFATLNRPAPDSFDVEVLTSAGMFELRLIRDWSPLGVDRAFYLFRNNFYEGARFYRVIDGFVAQFGGSGDAALDSIWRALPIADEPVRRTNARGTLAFARAGARSRSMTMFINLADNARLDSVDSGDVVGFPPLGRVTRGMDTVDSLFSGYGPVPMRSDLTAATLREQYPQLDSIAATHVTRMY